MKVFKLLGIPFFFMVLTTSHAASSLDLSKTFMTELLALSQHSKASAGKASAESAAKVKTLSAKVDFQSLAKRSFGAARWNKFAVSERKDFLDTFQNLLETVVYPKAKKITAKGDDLKYSALKTGQTKVVAKVEKEKRGEIVQQTLEIDLYTDDKSQKIYDAVIEGEILSANLKRQFDAALKKKTFAQIIAQMKKRIDETTAKAQ